MNLYKNNKIFLTTIIILFVASMILMIFNDISDGNKTNVDKKKVEKIINNKNRRLKDLSEEILNIKNKNPDNLPNFFYEKNKNLFSTEGIGLFLYKNNELKLWTTNDIPLPTSATFHHFSDNKIHNFNNGWYLCNVLQNKDDFIVALFQIKKDYSYQNDNLNYNYFSKLNIPDQIHISTDFHINSVKISIENSNDVFYLFLHKYEKINNYSTFFKIFCELITIILAFFLLFFCFNLFLQKFNTKKLLLFIIFITLSISICYIILNFDIFYNIRTLKLFGPQIFAQSFWLPSMGDLLINVLLSFIFSQFFCKYFKMSLQNNKKTIFFSNVIIAILISTAIYFILQNIYNIVINSSIPFDFINIFNQNIYSFISIFIIFLIIITSILILYKILTVFKEILSLKIIPLIFTLLSFEIIFGIINNSNYCHIFPLIIYFFLSFVFVSVLIFFIKKDKKINYSLHLFAIVLFSFAIAQILSHFSAHKTEEANKLILYNLSNDHDLMAEYFLKQSSVKIKKDKDLIAALKDENFEKLENKLMSIIKTERYFNKYDYFITICNSKDSLISEENYENCIEYFENLIRNDGINIDSTNFFFIKNNFGRICYISEISQLLSDSSDFKIYLEFNSRIFSEGIGYPELLLDKALIIEKDVTEFNFLKYRNNNLVKSKNNFQNEYSIIAESIDTVTFKTFNKNGYIYFSYRPDKEKLIILSKPYNPILNTIISFVYIFICFFVFFYIFLITKNIITKQSKTHLNLQQKIYLSSVAIMLISLVTLGFISLYFIKQIYKQKQKDILQDKINSIVYEMQTSLNLQNEINYKNKNEINDYLVNMSNTYFTDINIYDINGILQASSRGEFYDKGLKGRYISPIVFYELILNNAGYIFFDDKIDNMKYMSAFVPFRNKNNQVIAYLNLPYFIRPKEYITEISNFITTFTNIFLILLVISVIIGIVISRQILRPLFLIQSRIGQMDLKSKNQKIQYNRDDEIGSLVAEYNKKIDELQISAEKLAQSEREDAWREMARQIAHEIKNPLTPMKLNLQYLLQTYNKNNKKWEEIFKRMSIVIIEQIDTLSNIASEFSDFAKMPIAQRVKCDLKNIIENSVSVFNIDIEKIIFNLNFDTTKNYYIFADKEQMLRVFNNIIKNAIQAIPPERKGNITIMILENENNFIIEVIDNGIGISDEIVSKIFQPNFTTKSSGMGLGLSIVKTILLSNNASISFKTTKNIGTKFIIKIGIYNFENN